MVVTKHWDVLTQCDWTQLQYHSFAMKHEVMKNKTDSKHLVKRSCKTAGQICESRADERRSPSAMHPGRQCK